MPAFRADAETILAVASPPGHASRGIIRISGPDAWPAVAGLLEPPDTPPPRGLTQRALRLPLLPVPVPASIAWMPGPKSYTRENVVELHSFGSPVLLSLICDALLETGARIAGPGEFTRRAFLNGRIDLTQAEAVLGLIHAQNEAEHRQAFEHLRGALHERVLKRKEALVRVCAFCEAAIDFSDQDLEVLDAEWVENEITDAISDVEMLLAESRLARPPEEGLRTLLIGRPNVGKSSLLNCLAERRAALVSEFPGTTRDVVRATLSHGGRSFILLDTAGVRDAVDNTESASVGRARDAIRSAGLVLFVVDGSQSLNEEDRRIASEVAAQDPLLVVNKCDLPAAAILSHLPGALAEAAPVVVSAKTGAGRETLLERMAAAVSLGGGGGAAHAFMVNSRQRGCLMGAAERLRAALESAQTHAGLEFIALDLREALDQLGEVVGEVITDDLLDVIFSQFCIGK